MDLKALNWSAPVKSFLPCQITRSQAPGIRGRQLGEDITLPTTLPQFLQAQVHTVCLYISKLLIESRMSGKKYFPRIKRKIKWIQQCITFDEQQSLPGLNDELLKRVHWLTLTKIWLSKAYIKWHRFHGVFGDPAVWKGGHRWDYISHNPKDTITFMSS